MKFTERTTTNLNAPRTHTHTHTGSKLFSQNTHTNFFFQAPVELELLIIFFFFFALSLCLLPLNFDSFVFFSFYSNVRDECVLRRKRNGAICQTSLCSSRWCYFFFLPEYFAFIQFFLCLNLFIFLLMPSKTRIST